MFRTSNDPVCLQVRQADLSDVMGDIARFDGSHRTFNGKLVRAGRVVVLQANQKTERIIARGSGKIGKGEIALTSETRERLGISAGAKVKITFVKASFFDEFLWAWRATNPTDRVAARLGVVSVFLGFTGAILGLVSTGVSFPSMLTPLIVVGFLMTSALLIAIGYLWGSNK
jgi:hypothetical protein